MNRENLLRIASLLTDIQQENFDMENWRSDGSTTPKCNSVGCIIGHATFLDEKNVRDNYTVKDDDGIELGIRFSLWSQMFTGLSIYSLAWDWCFSYRWAEIDNTVEGARKRILYFLDTGKCHPIKYEYIELYEKY